MKVVLISPFFSDPALDPRGMLDRYVLLRALPRELVRLGHAVTVIVHAPVSETFEEAGIQYHFVQSSRAGWGAGRVAQRWKPRYGPAYYAPLPRLGSLLKAQQPDVVHFLGLTMDLHLARVLRSLQSRGTPVVAHYHGGLPATSRRLRNVQRHNVTRLSRVLFTTEEQADAWLAAGLGLRPEQVALILETSTDMQPLERCVARQRTGMVGDPVYVSTGRLHPVKDPLTLLEGFALIHAEQPGARLYLYYLSDEMLAEVRQVLNERASLRAAVELRGRASAAEMPAIYSSADFLLQASLREWSGLAVLEAMACGCVPVVTDIPSFRLMTEGGAYGRLFKPGDARGLAAAALNVDLGDLPALSDSVRRHLEDRLSFPALAHEVSAVYEEVVGRSGRL